MTAAHCEVRLAALRRTKDGTVVSFLLHPSEIPDCLLLDPLGQRYMIGIAAIGDDEQPVMQLRRADATVQEVLQSAVDAVSPSYDGTSASYPTAVVPERAENRDAAYEVGGVESRHAYAVSAPSSRHIGTATGSPEIVGSRSSDRPDLTNAIVKRAGILSSDKRFWSWINVADAEAAAAFIRRACAVASRRDLATNTGAAIRFQGLLDEFEASTGRRAEMRS